MRGAPVCGIKDQHSVGNWRKEVGLPGFTHVGWAVLGLPNVGTGREEVFQYLRKYKLAV